MPMVTVVNAMTMATFLGSKNILRVCYVHSILPVGAMTLLMMLYFCGSPATSIHGLYTNTPHTIQ